jgi:hypothetical protein
MIYVLGIMLRSLPVLRWLLYYTRTFYHDKYFGFGAT